MMTKVGSRLGQLPDRLEGRTRLGDRFTLLNTFGCSHPVIPAVSFFDIEVKFDSY